MQVRHVNVVVVFGNAGHGKDTLANRIATRLTEAGHHVRRTSFAEPLKLAAKYLVGIPDEIAYGSQAAKDTTMFYGRSARWWYQWLGTQIGRRFVSNRVWVDRMANLCAREPNVDVFVVSDGRFHNELWLDRTIRDLPCRSDEELDVRVFNVFVDRPSVPVKLWPLMGWRRIVGALLSPFGIDFRRPHESERELVEMRGSVSRGSRMFEEVVLNAYGLSVLHDRGDEIASKASKYFGL